tara:strand:- start:1047 stop:2081 length:1035 start_codon:yes stop_codon:yes gene_type:complete
VYTQFEDSIEESSPEAASTVPAEQPVEASAQPVPEAPVNMQANADSLVDLVDIPKEQAPLSQGEPRFAETKTSSEPDVAAALKMFNALDSELGDIEELKHDGFYDKIDESHIKDLPATARRILHNFRVDRELAAKKHRTELDAVKSDYEQRQAQLQQMERDFARRQAEFAAINEDPRVEQILNTPEDKLPDIYTEEGIQARIERGIAQGMRRVLEPMQAAAADKARESSYLDFVSKHPEMRESAFKSEVVKLVKTRKGSGNPISTQDAYQLVKARRVLAQRQARAQQESRARQESARHIRKATSSGSPTTNEIPLDVKKRGAVAIAKWLQSNPEAAKKISNQLR